MSNILFVSTVLTSIALNTLEILCLHWQYWHACIFGMVGKPWFSAVQHFFQIEMCVHVCIDCVKIHSIECIKNLMLVSAVSICMHIGMVEKPWFSAFQNFFRIENPLNINKVMDSIGFEPLKHDMIWSLVLTVSTWDTTQNALLWS